MHTFLFCLIYFCMNLDTSRPPPLVHCMWLIRWYAFKFKTTEFQCVGFRQIMGLPRFVLVIKTMSTTVYLRFVFL